MFFNCFPVEVWMTTTAWWLCVTAPARASFREGSWSRATCPCPPWMTSEAALESETLTALRISPTPPLVSGMIPLFGINDHFKSHTCCFTLTTRRALQPTGMHSKGTRNPTENWTTRSTTFTTSSTPCSTEPALCPTPQPTTPSFWSESALKVQCVEFSDI